MRPIVLTIIGVVIVLVLVYLLYKIVFQQRSLIAANTSLLSKVNPITTVTSTSVRYAYSIWINVNSWKMDNRKNIFSRTNNVTLWLDKTTPTLNLDIYNINTTPTPYTIMITDNFPLQKWTQVAFSVDNQYVDLYLDGKLIKSVVLPQFQIPPSSTDITIGNKECASDNTGNCSDILITRFYYWSKPLSPQDMWYVYMQGSGNNTFTFSNSYSASINFLKDNVPQFQFPIF